MTALELHVHHDADDLARGAADMIASELSWIAQRNGTASFAVSGGTTPWRMFSALSRHPLAWNRVHLFQVDERAVAADDDARSLKHLRESLLDHIDIPDSNVHPIPIEPDLDATAREYATTLQRVTGGVLDLVHLGLGADGHTASLVPGDPVLSVDDRLVASTGGEYQGTRRVTLTYPALAAARRILWIVDGAAKADALRRLVAADDTIPAGHVPQDRALVHCDEPAVSALLGGN